MFKSRVKKKTGLKKAETRKICSLCSIKGNFNYFCLYFKSIQVICCLARSRKPIKKHNQHQPGSLRAKMATHGLDLDVDLGQTGADSMNNGGNHSDCGAHRTESMDLICKL